jgi:hypothetical protein
MNRVHRYIKTRFSIMTRLVEIRVTSRTLVVPALKIRIAVKSHKILAKSTPHMPRNILSSVRFLFQMGPSRVPIEIKRTVMMIVGTKIYACSMNKSIMITSLNLYTPSTTLISTEVINSILYHFSDIFYGLCKPPGRAC